MLVRDVEVFVRAARGIDGLVGERVGLLVLVAADVGEGVVGEFPEDLARLVVEGPTVDDTWDRTRSAFRAERHRAPVVGRRRGDSSFAERTSKMPLSWFTTSCESPWTRRVPRMPWRRADLRPWIRPTYSAMLFVHRAEPMRTQPVSTTRPSWSDST